MSSKVEYGPKNESAGNYCEKLKTNLYRKKPMPNVHYHPQVTLTRYQHPLFHISGGGDQPMWWLQWAAALPASAPAAAAASSVTGAEGVDGCRDSREHSLDSQSRATQCLRCACAPRTLVQLIGDTAEQYTYPEHGATPAPPPPPLAHLTNT